MRPASRQDAVAFGVAGLSATAALALTAEPLAWPGVFAGLSGLWAMWRLPVRTTLLAVTFFALAVDSPLERPSAGWWDNPLRPLADLFYVNLHHALPLPFLRVSGLELVLLVLLLVALVRQVRGDATDAPPLPSPRPLRQALLLGVLALLALEGWGLSRGGDLKQSLFQLRVLLAVPVVAALGLYALRGARDLGALAKVVLVAAAVKVLTSVWFVYVICRPQGLVPPYATSHSDTVLYVVALMIVVARWWERPGPTALAEAAALGALIFVGLVLNDRRLAYASLAGAFTVVLALSPWNRARRWVVRAAVASLPALMVYAAVGWHSGAAVFRPVRDLKSLVFPVPDEESDESTRFRDDEDFNLVATWRRAPLLGAGFGHEFEEVVPLADLSRIMPDYHFKPHNSVLWLWTVGGLFGFTVAWLFLGVGVYFAARAYHLAVAPPQRAALLVALAAVVAFLNQAFGDMGALSYTGVFVLAPALALAGQLACAVGAWREGPRARAAGTLAAGRGG